MEPFFSVIVVSYRSGGKLRRTVANILEQTCTDLEIVIQDGLSDDGSTDGLPEDPRIRLFSGRDSGIYDAMNRAVKRASGRYFYFLNCGDLFFSKDVLEKVRAAAEAEEAAAPHVSAQDAAPRRYVFYGDIKERKSGQIVASNPVMDDFACYRNAPCHQACFYDRTLFAKRGFDTDLRVRADYEHFLWCVYRAHVRTVYLQFTVADYEGGGFSESPGNRKLSALEHEAVTALYLSPGKRLLYKSCMAVTLQPLREKIAHGKHTAALYDRVKNGIYHRK
ncbi:MAG: glycosyltransferase [Lachnospiraceae bacterium]|jgi:glycosyltransferase involved in cell wall biosynthesis|nr:glycosyltransferase [Lachnospiraceae bacterium]